ncbi:MAG: hypothetical protein LBV39_01155, partial [Bacteroidales bacterium]|nr:hypothetical protein [Bacteroidales bacterium]
MKSIFKLFIGVVTAMTTAGCIDSGYFGLSDEANILSFDIEGQLSNTVVPGNKEDVGIVSIAIPEVFQSEHLKVSKATCTQLAQFNIDPYSLTDFSHEIELTLTAENTKVHKRWLIRVEYGTASGQIPFSDMSRWAV